MKVSVEELNDILRKVNVELSQEKVNKELEKAYRQLNRTAKVRGFRPGKVPMSILRRHYADHITNEVGFELVNETLMGALQQTEMQVVSQSDLEKGPLKEDEPFRYSFLVEVKPEIVVSDYHKIPARRERLLVSEDEVDAELELRKQTSAYLETLAEPRPIQLGDYVVLDFQAFTGGKPVTDGEAKGFHLEVGANRFNADFESELIGANKGDQKEIEVTFPADYGNRQLAGRKTTFQVDIKDIRVRIVPELDDEFAKSLGEFSSLQELRDAVLHELESKKQGQIDNEVNRQILDELIERNPFTLPQGMVEQELQRMLDTVRTRLSAQNLTLEQAGMDEQTFTERNRDSAERRVRISILLERIAAQESLEVSDEELDEGLRRSSKEMKQPYEKLRDFYKKRNLIDPFKIQLLEEKVIKYLTERAEITEVEASTVDSESKKEENL